MTPGWRGHSTGPETKKPLDFKQMFDFKQKLLGKGVHFEENRRHMALEGSR